MKNMIQNLHRAKALLRNPAAERGPYPAALRETLSRTAAAQAMATISAWQGYARTPLVALPELARQEGVGAIHYKHESARFGLGSFKALGGAYAVLRLLARLAREQTGLPVTEEDILSGQFAGFAAGITVCCATDGNHGRSVAWGGELFGCKVVIFVHATVSQDRAEAIRAFGAEVIRTAGTYDDSVREAARMAAENRWHVVSDTSYPGYTDVPRDVMQGYTVMAEEALAQLDAPPTHVFLQGGVGGLAAAVTATFWEALGAARPLTVVVEPETAACLLASARTGTPTAVTGDLETIMAGLACGEPSLIAWPVLRGGADAFMAIDDAAAAATMRLLASGHAGPRLVAGESGVAGLAGFLALDPQERAALGMTPASRILAFGSEGDTDAGVYAGIVGETGAALRAKGAL
jgi:diaminopropionate ammonia-lyase